MMLASKAGFCDAQGPQLACVKCSRATKRGACAIITPDNKIAADAANVVFFMLIVLSWLLQIVNQI
jgi:hypothetical protein